MNTERSRIASLFDKKRVNSNTKSSNSNPNNHSNLNGNISNLSIEIPSNDIQIMEQSSSDNSNNAALDHSDRSDHSNSR